VVAVKKLRLYVKAELRPALRAFIHTEVLPWLPAGPMPAVVSFPAADLHS
jgi:hypothetical protein